MLLNSLTKAWHIELTPDPNRRQPKMNTSGLARSTSPPAPNSRQPKELELDAMRVADWRLMKMGRKYSSERRVE
jgi:hypothetical protein